MLFFRIAASFTGMIAVTDGTCMHDAVFRGRKYSNPASKKVIFIFLYHLITFREI